ncbi:hypothetical protein E5288_WYG005609 [Bos mutus]|uniref:Uncharacterized protein n=1 Tax=Bos mutus TaxID=72004 RepID=A0A6B0RQU8_9CETA|nr:hypothetical protein [Bos mutus]
MCPLCVWRVGLSPGPGELKMPPAREEATATARLFLELLLALDDFMERLARVLSQPTFLYAKGLSEKIRSSSECCCTFLKAAVIQAKQICTQNPFHRILYSMVIWTRKKVPTCSIPLVVVNHALDR